MIRSVCARLNGGLRRAGMLFVLPLCALPASQAMAQNAGLIDATRPEQILEYAKAFGIAELGRDSSGMPKIDGRMEGKRYANFFYGCKQNVNCTDIQFVAYWPASQSPGLQALNAWHMKKRFGTAYLDGDGDMVLKLPVNIEHGVSPKNLEDSFSWWQVALRGFIKDVVKQD